MAGKRPSTPAERDERLCQYAQLRDQGLPRTEAAREVGVSYSGAGAVYERWYLADRGIRPPHKPQWPGPWFA